MRETNLTPKKRSEKKRVVTAKNGVNQTGVIFVGIIGVILAVGAIVFSFLNPTSNETLWKTVSPMLSMLLGYMIFGRRGGVH
jgi:hypothetical protein